MFREAAPQLSRPPGPSAPAATPGGHFLCWRPLTAALVLALLAAGCGETKKPSGTLSGTVSHAGTLISSGNLNVLSKQGVGALGVIQDGKFTISDSLETGDYSVYVSPPIPEQRKPGTPAPVREKFDVPTKFQNPATSGKTITLKPGLNTVDIDFRD
ncbi:MAG: hypothetical protein IT428_02485 [Planctomycetaceae bacterium]|nr:hypothetical protein [Planctomycetaceae bacterium]